MRCPSRLLLRASQRWCGPLRGLSGFISLVLPYLMAASQPSLSFRNALAGGFGCVAHQSPDLCFPAQYYEKFQVGDPSSLIKKATVVNGKRAVVFSNDELLLAAENFKYTLVGKFSSIKPKIEVIRKFFADFSMVGSCNVGSLDGRHIMIKLNREEDYTLLFTRKSLRISDIPLKILKWTVDFDPRIETPIIPIWFSFPNLKLHYFHPEILFSIGSILGKPLQLDLPTKNLTHPSVARILIERNITHPIPEEIWIGSKENGGGAIRKS